MKAPKTYLYKRIVQAKLFIDAHYAEPIDLDNTADEAYFSKFHFIRLFKSVYGLTPHQYLTRVRMDRAAEWLKEGSSVSDVCFRVGFDSLPSFTSLFRKHFSSTPSAFQKMHEQRKELIRKNPLQFIPNCFAQNKGWI